jgi:hypothetical protein
MAQDTGILDALVGDVVVEDLQVGAVTQPGGANTHQALVIFIRGQVDLHDLHAPGFNGSYGFHGVYLQEGLNGDFILDRRAEFFNGEGDFRPDYCPDDGYRPFF